MRRRVQLIFYPSLSSLRLSPTKDRTRTRRCAECYSLMRSCAGESLTHTHTHTHTPQQNKNKAHHPHTPHQTHTHTSTHTHKQTHTHTYTHPHRHTHGLYVCVCDRSDQRRGSADHRSS